MLVLAGALPWVISVFLHAGVIILMLFVVLISANAGIIEEPIIFPDAQLSDTPGGSLNPGSGNPNLKAQQNITQTVDQQWATRRSDSNFSDPGQGGKPAQVIGVAGGGLSGGGLSGSGLSGGGLSGGQLAPFGLTTGGSGAGPKSKFMGSGGNAHHVVYLVDRSGSMVESFDSVKRELLLSIGRLVSVQDFHVIFFSSDEPVEKAPRSRCRPTTPTASVWPSSSRAWCRRATPRAAVRPTPAWPFSGPSRC